jgi:pyruvate dehydrogenase E2 component (dihydrolipoamide acetyltransferase)
VAVVSPVVRKLAKENGVDLRTIGGSGPDGLVLRKDVEAAIVGDESTRIPLRGIRGAVAERLTRSRREIPEATVWVDVDATGLLSARKEINAADPANPVGLLALLARFCVLGLARYPALNSTVDTERAEIVLSQAVHLGFAAQTPRGLVVPVIKNAEDLNSRKLSAELGKLTAAAREGTIAPAQLTGGTFTVNNYGVFGVDGSAAIINHPEAAIVGMGRIIDRPWVVDGKLEVRKVTQLTLAFDHRVCDGEVAGGFLRFVADCVEHPTALLGDL